MDPVGFAVNESGDKVYAVTGKGELVTLDGKTSQVTSRVKVDPSEPKHYFLNIALNTTKGVGLSPIPTPPMCWLYNSIPVS
jgi:hypothetical protein